MTAAYRAWFPGAAPLGARQRRWLLVILAVATVARLAWVLYAARFPQGLHDPPFYNLHGVQLAHGEGYHLSNGPTAYYPIGYPATLGALYWLMFHTPIPDGEVGMIAASNLVFGVLTVLLTVEVARRVFGNATGLLAGAIVALYPNLIFHTAIALSETLFNLVFMGLVLVLVSGRWDRAGPGTARLVATGVLVALSALVRPISLLLLPVLLAVWLVAGWGWRRTLERLALVTIVTVAVIAPWTIRNAVVMDAFVPISTNTGDNLCMSRQPGANGGFYLTDYCFGGFDGLPRPEYEIARDRRGRERAIEFVRDHPVREVELWFWRMRETMHNDHDGLNASESYGDDPFLPRTFRSVLARTADWYFFATVALTVAGLPMVLRGRDPKRLFLVLTLASLLLPAVIFFGDPRFHVPASPFFAIEAAFTLVCWRRLWTQSHSTTEVTAAQVA